MGFVYSSSGQEPVLAHCAVHWGHNCNCPLRVMPSRYYGYLPGQMSYLLEASVYVLERTNGLNVWC